jgi:photosystem II stability/assembly factor-like uncharacterized protein
MRTQLPFRSFSALALLAFCVFAVFSQDPQKVDPSIAKEIAELEQRLQKLQEKLRALKDESFKKEEPTKTGQKTPGKNAPAKSTDLDVLMTWRPIGPANMGGRITALAVQEADPSCFYVATASGGLLKTINNGSTFVHQFDRENTISLGAVAVAKSNPDIVWVGTGEANPRNSVSFGDGVYQSLDGGKMWQNKGLKKSFQIGKIIIHPKNPDIVYVAALGRLYGPSAERGLYKTTDSGKTWQRVWFHDDKTGVLELVMHPSNPEILILAAWERRRDEFDTFLGDAKPPPATDQYAPATEHGPGGGIFKSTDGGATWSKITKGLPKANLGRIGLDWHPKNPKLLFAIIDSEHGGMGLEPSKGYLGLTPENSPEGVKVADLQKDGPAGKAKLSKGDFLLAVNDKELKKTDDLLLTLQPLKPGDTIKLSFRKGDKKETAEITLTDRPGEGKGKNRGNLSAQIDESEDGILFTDVIENGAAHKAGLQVGDLLLTVDGTKISSMPVLAKILQAKNVGDEVTITYQRGQTQKELKIKLEVPPPPPGRPFAGQLGGQKANMQDLQGPDSDKTGGIYRSEDGGDSWVRINSLNERPFYFSVVRSDPRDEKTIYALGIVLYRSTDGGKSFSPDGINKGVHSDLHEMWINPKDSRHLLIGTDGGVYVSYDRGANWEFQDYLALGQFYHVAVDTRKPYRAYGGLQDNGSWGGPSQTLRPSGPTNADYQYVQGGDGFVCRVDPNDPDIVYSESQNGNMFRRNLRTGESKSLRPKIQPGANKYRFNWNTPFILSQHNSSIFYAAGNYVFRSVKKGEDLRIISPEITRTKHGTATALAESPKNPEVLWVGTDDGAVWLTRDGGKTWTELSDKLKTSGLPGPRWVASIEPSRAVAGRCYLVFDAHRSDDDEPYVYVTEDYGQSWKSLRANLPTGSTRVLREDLTNPELLYLGTEFAIFASTQRGATWFKLNGPSLPTVAIHEIAQPITANEIVAATHGRSLWVLDVTTLRQVKDEPIKTALFAPATFTRWQLDFTHEGMFRTGTRTFIGQNPSRQATFDYYLAQKPVDISLKVLDPEGKVMREFDLEKEAAAGWHRIAWDLVGGPGGKGKKEGKGGMGPAQTPGKGQGKGQGKAPGKTPGTAPLAQIMKPGVYVLALEVDGMVYRRVFSIEADPRTQTPGVAENEAEELRRWLGGIK